MSARPPLLAGILALVTLALVAAFVRAELHPPPSSPEVPPAAAYAAVPTTAAGLQHPPLPADVTTAMDYQYNGPESPADHRYDYYWQLLRAALERTIATWGPYRATAVPAMSEERQAEELQRDGGRLNLVIRGDSIAYSQRFAPVWIPIDKGLLGYRVLLIRADDQPRLARMRTLADLATISIGQGRGWPDIDILRANGLTVMAGGDYDGLFAMLANRRFDAFSRGVDEVLTEYALRRAQFPGLAIERTLLLHYPIARYFWFSRSPAGARLAQRVHEGLLRLLEDGSLDRMFAEEHRRLFAELRLEDRRLVELTNPLAAPGQPPRDPRMWYAPAPAGQGGGP